MPASKKATAKKVVGTIFSYMRKRKQERKIRSFLNPVPASRLSSSPSTNYQYFRLLPPPQKKLPPPSIPSPCKTDLPPI